MADKGNAKDNEEKEEDDNAINISLSILDNLENILHSNPTLQLNDIENENEQILKEKSTLLELKKSKKSKKKNKKSKSHHKRNVNNLEDEISAPINSIEMDLGINIDEEKKIMDDNDDNDDDSSSDRIKTYILELPREMLTAYILLCLKYKNDWNDYKWYGRFGVFCAYIIPFGIQIIVTFALMSEVKIEKFKIDTSEKQLIFNLCALGILFIYIFVKCIGLIKSTWYYLNKLEKDEKRRKFGNKYDNNNNIETLDSLLTPEFPQQFHNETNRNTDKRWIIYWIFRLQIIINLILYFALMLYALIRINSKTHIVDKLEVAISIFFILEVDDWGYQLFIGQNMILSDCDFNIELIIPIEDHTKQLTKNRKSLWCSLSVIIFSVTSVVVISIWYL